MDPGMHIPPQTLATLQAYFERTGTPVAGSLLVNGTVTPAKLSFSPATSTEVQAAQAAANAAQTSAGAAQAAANAAQTSAGAAQAAAGVAQTTANSAQQGVDTLSDLITLREQYAMFWDNKGNAAGGDFPALTWVTRDLTHIRTMTPPGWASLNTTTSVITLPAGTYQVSASAPAFRVDDHKLVLARASDGAVLVTGTKEFASSSDPGRGQTRSFVTGRFTLTSSTGVQLRHYAETEKTGNGLGKGPTNPADFGANIFTTVEIWRVS
jgi:hypothetical protein